MTSDKQLFPWDWTAESGQLVTPTLSEVATFKAKHSAPFVTIHITPERLAALIQHLDHDWLPELVREFLRDAEQAAAGATAAGQGKTGATAGRILDILREAKGPMKPAAIVKAAKAPDWQVRLTLKELAADGQIRAAGATINKTYTLAKGGAK